MSRRAKPLVACVLAGSLAIWFVSAAARGDADSNRTDPAVWGSDHVGQPHPPYMTGDECLFCHRQVGNKYSENRHQRTIRPLAPGEPSVVKLRQLDGGQDLAIQIHYLMGSRRITRFLKRSKDYGKLELLSALAVTGNSDPVEPDLQRVVTEASESDNAESPRWEKDTFGDRCAGCHTTAVDTTTKAFSALSLDCYVCHGPVELEHTHENQHALLSTNNQEPRRVISICGQCHLRGGVSKSSGLPYPNTFVAGDNLFRDFQVDLSADAIRALPVREQHIFFNARDVAVAGRLEMTCLTCHDVHGQSSVKHFQLKYTAICGTCHDPDGDGRDLRRGARESSIPRSHNTICDY